MSLRQKLLLEMEDVPDITVEYDGRDLRAWEVAHKKSALVERMSVSMLSWLGWNAARRQGLLNGSHSTWAQFDAVCIGVEGAADDEETDAELDPPSTTTAPTPESPGDG